VATEVLGEQVVGTAIVPHGNALGNCLIPVLSFQHSLNVGLGAEVVVKVRGGEPCNGLSDDRHVGVLSQAVLSEVHVVEVPRIQYGRVWIVYLIELIDHCCHFQVVPVEGSTWVEDYVEVLLHG